MQRFLIGIPVEKELAIILNTLSKRLLADNHLLHQAKIEPHITLVPPFTCSDEQLHVIQQQLLEIGHRSKGFTLAINGFNHFNDRVLFAAPTHAEPLLALHQSINQALLPLRILKAPSERFHPHITLAKAKRSILQLHRQLDNLPSEFVREFYVDQMLLWKFTDRWNVVTSIPLAG